MGNKILAEIKKLKFSSPTNIVKIKRTVEPLELSCLVYFPHSDHMTAHIYCFPQKSLISHHGLMHQLCSYFFAKNLMVYLFSHIKHLLYHLNLQLTEEILLKHLHFSKNTLLSHHYIWKFLRIFHS